MAGGLLRRPPDKDVGVAAVVYAGVRLSSNKLV